MSATLTLPSAATLPLNERELAAILAGLHAIQHAIPPEVLEIATGEYEFDPLDPEEIDGLIERIAPDTALA